jgi:PBP1b-binding outer membrane lipoprotein LpoB
MNNKLIIALLSGVIVIGCSKKEQAPENHEPSTEATATTDAATDVETAVPAEANSTPVTEQKPDTILSTTANPVEQSRRMVREAQVAFSAQDLVKTTLAVDKLTIDTGGFIEQKNINFQVTDVETQNIADGKIKVFEKVEPQAEMVVRIPSEKAADFVNQLLPLMYFMNQQQYSAKRYELKLLEEKIEQTQTVAANTRPAQFNEIARLTQMETQDRVRYSTIALHINQPTLVRERIDVNINAVARLNADSFWKRAWNGVQYGWQFVLDLLVFLITIWPLYIILILGLALYKTLAKVLNRYKSK